HGRALRNALSSLRPVHGLDGRCHQCHPDEPALVVRVALLAAMPTELRPLARMLSLRRTALGGRPAYTGVLGDIEVVAAVTGMGPANATETTEWLLDAVAVDHLVNVGVAGGVS